MDAWYSHEHLSHQGHDELIGGRVVPCFELPVRAERARDAWSAAFAAAGGQLHTPQDGGLGPILAVHDADYAQFLQDAWPAWTALGRSHPALGMVWHAGLGRPAVKPRHIEGQLGYYSMDAGCPIVAGTWNAVYWSAQVAISATRALMAGAPAAFAICRPPGHHAAAATMGGYCYLNNAAIAAQLLRSEGGHGKVAIVDIDYHHGNGTQAIFWERADVFFTSLHASPHDDYPYLSGHAEEVGEGAGRGATLNFPLPAGTEAPAYLAALDQALDAVAASGASASVVSLGVDTFELDPISRFKLREADYLVIGQHLRRLPGPVLFVFEGGYATDEVGRNAVAVLQGYEGAGG